MPFAPADPFRTRPDLAGTFGMTASTHWTATATAQSVLERGGNAFDAAVAAGFVLQLVEPHLNGPGGDMTAVFQRADDSRPRVLMGQGPAPAGATPAHFHAEGMDLVPGSGALAAAVPGAVDAWLLLLRDHGTWTLRDVLGYAIGYARDGHPLLPSTATTIASVAGLFRDHWPTSADRWMPDGRVPEPGTLVRNPAYAEVLRELVAAAEHAPSSAHGAARVGGADATDGADAGATGGGGARPDAGPAPRTGDPADPGSNQPDPSVIRGISVVRVASDVDDVVPTGATVAHGADRSREAGIDAARARWRAIVGDAVEEFVRTPHRHADGSDHAGVMTARDIEGFEASIEDAVTAEFRGWTIAKTGPWGQGPVLLQALKILEGFDDDLLDPSTERGIHTIAEALKLAFADREAWYGDGLDSGALAHLLSDEYAAERRRLIAETASHEQRPGAIPGRPTPLAPPVRTDADVAAAGIGEPTVPGARPAASGPDTDGNGVTRGDTCHLDVVDQWGNIVSATPSGGWLQSSPTIPALGFCLGTRLQMTRLDASSPSRLQPGRRPRTTLTPTLVLRDGEPVMALGSPGGDQQDQWQLLMLLRVLVGGYTPQQAIDAPALHTTSFPGSFWPRTGTPGGLVVEDRVGDEVIRGLEARGHAVARTGDWSLGRLSAVTRDPATGILGAAANPRGAQGYAAGR